MLHKQRDVKLICISLSILIPLIILLGSAGGIAIYILYFKKLSTDVL